MGRSGDMFGGKGGWFVWAIFLGTFCHSQAVASKAEQSRFDMTCINLEPGHFRAQGDPDLAAGEHIEPLFAGAKVLPNAVAEAAGEMKNLTKGFPKEWKGFQIPASLVDQTSDGEELNKLLKEKDLHRVSTDVMCFVLQLKEGDVTNLQIVFRKTNLIFRQFYDDDEVLPFGGYQTSDPTWLKGAGWKSVTRALPVMKSGETLICPLYICEFVEPIPASPEEFGTVWRVTRGDVWLPQKVRYTDQAGIRHEISAAGAIRRRYSSVADDGNSLAKVRESLAVLGKQKPLVATKSTKPTEGSAPASTVKWLVNYFSFSDSLKMLEERQAHPSVKDAFLDFPWLSSGLSMPKSEKPPQPDGIAFPEPVNKSAYQHAFSGKKLTITNADITALSIRLTGGSVTNAWVKVRRVKLDLPVYFFRSDRSLVWEDYFTELTKLGKVQDEEFPIGAISSDSGMNIPLLVTQRIAEDTRTLYDEAAESWTVLRRDVILPISIVYEEGSYTYEVPIRPMAARPWVISSELFGRN